MLRNDDTANSPGPAYNNTIINCGWRRSKNKKGGSVWVEKAAKPIFVNNLIYDSRFGLKQPKKDGADMEHSRLTPNYYFASTETGVAQMAKGAELGIWFDTDIMFLTYANRVIDICQQPCWQLPATERN